MLEVKKLVWIRLLKANCYRIDGEFDPTKEGIRCSVGTVVSLGESDENHLIIKSNIKAWCPTKVCIRAYFSTKLEVLGLKTATLTEVDKFGKAQNILLVAPYLEMYVTEHLGKMGLPLPRIPLIPREILVK